MKKNWGMMKRILSLTLAILLTLSCVPVQAFATETEPMEETVETVLEETTVSTEAETAETTEPSTVPETTGETEPTVEQTAEPTVPETMEETVPEITVEETAPVLFSAAEESWNVNTDALSNTITVKPGQLMAETCEIVDNEIYGYVANYPLRKGHILSISNSDYVFSVRKLSGGNYNTMLKQATAASFTATEDMTVGMLIRKPDKSAVTAEELANIVIYDSQFGMIGVEGSVKRFTVEAETIDGGTATTRAAIFLPESYSDSGKPTRLVVMTNGHSAYLTNSVWNKNSPENVQVIQNYLNADYAVWVVDNTAASTSQTPDLGCPQLVDSYFKAYEYIQNNLNVEQKFSIHARSFGTFAAVRIMREHPELVKCAVMTGSRVSIKAEWPGIKKAHVAKRFGFADTTGATYEADKLVGYDPYTDVNDATYTLPPTFWMLANGDSTAKPCEFIEKLTAYGNDVTLKFYSDISHSGICTLNTSETFADALAYLEKHQVEVHTHSYSAATTAPTCTEQGYTTYNCTCGDSYVDDYVDATDVHTYENGICTGCGAEDPNAAELMSLRYDDHYNVTGKTVEIIDAGTPTSYQVGYGVEENAIPDTAVVTLAGDNLVATGIGIAYVHIDGVLYEVTVEAAPISLLLLIGQSNMEGMVGNANQSIACENGQVYSTYAKANGLTGDAGLTVDNAGNYVPSALAGMYSAVNVNGTDTKLSEYPVKSLTEAGNGKYGADSGIAYEWTKQTGEKVWVVNAAHGASSITSWQKGASNYEEAVALFSDCQTVLKKEIAAGHYTFSHMGYYWCQGCADETQTAEWYVGQYLGMHENLKADLAFDADFDASTTDRTLEFGNIILVMAGHETAVGYRKGTHMDSSDAFFATFKELEMRGPRVAQIWMANNPELADINMVCTLAQDWVAMPDGTDGVSEYFRSHYENGTVDYPTQTAQSDVWRMPTTPASVKNSIHYYQIGYNEVGREAARNTLYILDLLEKPEVEPEVVFYDWTGYQEPDSIKSTAVGSSATLVVPMVYPCYKSKDITYFLSGGLKWDYYDLLATGVDGGTLTASIGTQTVTVTGRQYCSYRFELVDGKMISISNDTFHENLLTATNSNTYTLEDTILLKHDKEWVVEFDSVADARFMALASSKSATDGMFYFFKSKSGSGVLSLGEYKDGLYQNYGLKQTEVNIDWTQPHVYQFRNKVNEDGSNTIHIYVDGEWMGTATNLIINDVLQSTDNMYLSGKDFAFTSIGCGGFALGDDQMTYLEVWETACAHTYKSTLTAPTCTEQGYTTHTCTVCGNSYVDSYVAAKGHTEVIDKAIAATCTTAGKTEGKHCSVCSAVIVAQKEVPAKGHTEVTDKAVSATCTTAGKTEGKHCSTCGTVLVAQKEIPALGHSFGTWTVTAKPTCTEKGSECRECSNCDYYETREVAANGHTEIIDKAVAATCTTTGLTEGKHCSVCNVVLIAQKEVPAKGHGWDNGKVTKEPTEQTEGMKTYTCTACGETKTETIPILSHAHKYTAKVTTPTCTEQGYTTYTCTCGDSCVDNYIKAIGHSYGAWTVISKPACTEKGQERRDCANCDHSETREVAANGHTEVIDKAVVAICTTAGKTEGKHCSTCGTVLVAQKEIPAPGHSYGAWIVTTNPTCTEKGQERRDCNNCDAYETRDVAAKGHTEVTDKAVSATCTTAGKTEGKHCSVCNTVLVKQNEIPAKGHTWDTGKVTKEPTEQTEGMKTYTCTACGETMTETIPTLDHTHKYNAKETAPTCTAQGYTTYSCACGDSYVDNYVKATGHSYGAWMVTTKPTCTEKGTERRDCNNCDAYETREVAAKGHAEVIDKAVAATCTTSGLTEGKHCSVCNTVLVAQTKIAALGHNWDVGVVTKEPSEAEEGESVFTCQTCGETKIQKLPILSHVHKYIAVVTEPTCTEKGYTTYTCSCGDSYVDDYVEATGHEAGQWQSDEKGHWRVCAVCSAILDKSVHSGTSCTICGHETPEQSHGYELGDVNHDGKINAKDATLILQKSVGVLKETAKFCEDCAEVSGDGKLNAKDSTLILQFSVGLRDSFPAQEN